MAAAVGAAAWGSALQKLHQMGTHAAALLPGAAVALVAFLLFFSAGTAVRSVVRRVAMRRRQREGWPAGDGDVPRPRAEERG